LTFCTFSFTHCVVCSSFFKNPLISHLWQYNMNSCTN
jgi:hypothetical protein